MTKDDGRKYRCIECGKEAAELYHSYCDGVIKVKHCHKGRRITRTPFYHMPQKQVQIINLEQTDTKVDQGVDLLNVITSYVGNTLPSLKLYNLDVCTHVVDKYVEHDPVIVCVDALLHRSQVYRHLLFNVQFPSSWKLALVYLLCDTYIQWQNIEKQKMRPIQDDHIFYAALEWDIYSIFVIKLIEWLVLVGCVTLLLALHHRFIRSRNVLDNIGIDLSVSSFCFVHRILVLSSFAKLLAISALIWAQAHSRTYLLLTSILVFTSNVAAFKVLPGIGLISAAIVLLLAHVVQLSVGNTMIRRLYA